MCTASSMGASARLAVTRPMPMPSVMDEVPVAFSVPLRTCS
jgi:hypothetical protein